jgi:hypothetical protein
MSVPAPQLSLVQVQDALYTWISTELKQSIDPGSSIWREQSQALPPRPCVTMKITDGPQRTGYGDNVQYLNDGLRKNFKIGGQRLMTCSIQIFGSTIIRQPGAYQSALRLNASLSRLTVLDRLRSAGIAVLKQGDVLNITELEETEYEERAQFDVQLCVAENMTDDPGIIEHANITETIS